MRKHLIVIAIVIAIALSLAVALLHRHPQTHQRPLIPQSILQLISESKPLINIESLFANWSTIPRKYTCDGLDVSPPIVIRNVPTNSRCLALIMYDPDAPHGVFYHWILYDIPANASSITIPASIPHSSKTPYGIQGLNSFGFIGYGGPCPPRGSKHRYVVLVLALSSCPNLPPGLRAPNLISALRGKVIAYGLLVGIYGR